MVSKLQQQGFVRFIAFSWSFLTHVLHISLLFMFQSLERNPEAARALVADGHEVASHGYRWYDAALFLLVLQGFEFSVQSENDPKCEWLLDTPLFAAKGSIITAFQKTVSSFPVHLASASPSLFLAVEREHIKKSIDGELFSNKAVLRASTHP